MTQIEKADSLFDEGRYEEAEKLYRELLQKDEKSVRLLEGLGRNLVELCRFDEAEKVLSQVISKEEKNVDAINWLVLALLKNQKMEQALLLCEKAIKIDNKNAGVYKNLAVGMLMQQKLPEAEKNVLKALDINRKYPEALCVLAIIKMMKGDFAGSENCFAEAEKIKPNLADIYINRAYLCLSSGKEAQALQEVEKAVELKPWYDSFKEFRAQLLGTDVHEDEKERKTPEEILAVEPSDFKALAALITEYKKQHKNKGLAKYLENYLKEKPEDFNVWIELGLLFLRLYSVEEALKAFNRVLVFYPENKNALLGKIHALWEEERNFEAIECAEKWAEIYGLNSEICMFLGILYFSARNKEKGRSLLEKAVNEGKGILSKHYCSYLGFLNYMDNLSPEHLFERHLDYGKLYASEKTNSNMHSNEKDKNRLLRIGYVSGDFKAHSVMYFFMHILKNHSMENFEIYCYSKTTKTDIFTDKIKSLPVKWKDVKFLTAEDAAAIIRKDKIDILVDLSGHTGNNFLSLFALKPAPVQVSYIGYPNTTGLKAMDYRIVDEKTDPYGEADKYATEELVRLPDSFLCYRSLDDNVPETSSLPFKENGYITFGSFNNAIKIGNNVIKVWAEILNRVPNSKLILKAKQLKSERIKKDILSEFADFGISEDRVQCVDFTKDAYAHLQLYSGIDICLDTFPYNGTTTTCQALWQGVPVVAMEGDRHSARVSKSLLYTLGLKDFVAENEEEYIELAVKKASDIEALSELRKILRFKMANSPLCDEKDYIEKLEKAYRHMWEKWCDGPDTYEFEAVENLGISDYSDGYEENIKNIEEDDFDAIKHRIQKKSYDYTTYQILMAVLDKNLNKEQKEKFLSELLENIEFSNDEAFDIALLLNEKECFSCAEKCFGKIVKEDLDDTVFQRKYAQFLCKGKNYQKAQEIFDKIILSGKADASVYNSMGEMFYAKGQSNLAEEYFDRAISEDDSFSDALINYYQLLKEKGGSDEIQQIEEKVDKITKEQIQIKEIELLLKENPKDVVSIEKLGILYASNKQFDKAEECFHRLIDIAPRVAEPYLNLCVILYKQGKIEEAERYAREAINRKDNYIQAKIQLTYILKALNRYEEAEDLFKDILKQQPNNIEALRSLILILYNKNKYAEVALFCADLPKELSENEDVGKVYIDSLIITKNFNKEISKEDEEFLKTFETTGVVEQMVLGRLLRAVYLYLNKNKLEEASSVIESRLQKDSKDIDLLIILGRIFFERLEYEKALEIFDRVLEIDPNNLEGLFGRSVLLGMFEEYEESLSNLNTLMDKVGRQIKYLRIIGNTYVNLRKTKEAEEIFEEIFSEKRERNSAVNSSYIFFLHYSSEISNEKLFEKHIEWDKFYTSSEINKNFPHLNERDKNKKLRIGYVSGDFKSHSVIFFAKPFLVRENRKNSEVYCYSNVGKPDDVTEKIKKEVDYWRDIKGLSFEKIKQIIREDKIDILVDLSGHTGFNLLPLFALKPAPVQVSYIGYPNTTGLKAMDYRIVDEKTDPYGEADKYATEELVRLPDSFLCYKPYDIINVPEVSPLPAEENGYITFGSFNNISKLGNNVIKVWAEILNRIPDSKMIIKARQLKSERIKKDILNEFEKYGVSKDRVQCINYVKDTYAHLQLYSGIDICLDTFPYNGTTTTCQALWQGVPVLAIDGKRHSARVSKSLLCSVGLDDFVAENEEDLVELAVKKASDIEALSDVRKNLRDNMIVSPLCDEKAYIEKLAKAYRYMWEKWCDGPDTYEFKSVENLQEKTFIYTEE